MPVIIVEGPPRSVEQKSELVKKLTIALKEAYDFPEEFTQISVIIKENLPENIGSNGQLLIHQR